jgi:hypothetical protein
LSDETVFTEANIGYVQMLGTDVRTVTVRGRVYRQTEVNYYLYGLWARLAGLGEQEGIDRIRRYWLGAWVGADVHPADAYFDAKFAWYVAGYRGNMDFPKMTAIPGPEPGGEEWRGGLWYRVGYGRYGIFVKE